MARDGGVCQVRWDADCTIEATELDHIVMHADGGHDGSSNLRASCASCNGKRNLATRRGRRTSRRPIEPNPGLIAEP